MIDVDFLPAWYHQLQRRKRRIQRQYLLWGLAFLGMVVWNAFATRAISMASAELSLHEPQRLHAEYLLHEVEQAKGELEHWQGHSELIEMLDSRLDVASLMAELSQVVPEGIRITQLRCQARRFTDPVQDLQGDMIKSPFEKNLTDPFARTLGSIRFLIVIQAEATGTQPIATFLSDLEESTYFHHVHLRFTHQRDSRESEAKAAMSADDSTVGADGLYHATCEIRCYMANYVEP